ncbi:uncharacterized protein LOC121375146 isoform X3 [Gigantopelta aegis]|uniref:uncharacterized protein LOC121375146 isoform X3 n=1 Tax=Gigantopelta aegis TaxID=1735272 RepID=UPI001B888772|nr:uncharacterized protein LOC121375146 isoform X3 [Gigantopelta aegis]
MPGPEMPSDLSSERKLFQVGLNRRTQLALKQELDSVTSKTIAEIAAMKQARMMEPLTDDEITTRKLCPQFVPQKIREKRKLHPIFHEDIKVKEHSKEEPTVITNVPRYNPLEKKCRLLPSKTRKYPYVKDSVVTTADLKKPHISSVGVTPHRQSSEIPELKVVLTGKSATTEFAPSNISLAEIKTATALYSRPPTTPQVSHTKLDRTPEEEEEDLTRKPAILSQVGTSKPLALCDRRTGAPKPLGRKRSSRRLREPDMLADVMRSSLKSGRSLGSSFQSEEIVLPDDRLYGQYDEAILDIDVDDVETAVGQKSAASAMKSVKELCEEAKQIASPNAPPIYKQYRKCLNPNQRKDKLPPTPRRKVTKRKDKLEALPKKVAKVEKEDTASVGTRPRSERSVDEIIASLRDQSRKGTVSEADRRIQEIMSRVMSRASDYMRDDETEKTASQDSFQELEPENVTDEAQLDGAIAAEEQEEEELQFAEESKEVLEEEQPANIPPPVEEELLPSDRTGDVQQVSDHEDEEPSLDIQQAWIELNLPPEATYEDLVSIQGKQKEIQCRSLPEPYTGPRLPVQGTAMSFLSTWAPRETRERPEPVGERPLSRNIHHFCTETAEFQLPRELQNIGRKYHTPDRFTTFPQQPYRFGRTGPEEAVEDDLLEMDEDARISDAAERIVNEVNTADSEVSFEAWQQKANQVFSQLDLNIEGTRMFLRSDESRVYWDPAPAKLDVMPARVKDILFPEYDGMTGVHSTQDVDLMEIQSETTQEEDVDLLELAPEDQEALDRTFMRKHNSAEDLTELVKASRHREAVLLSDDVDTSRKPSEADVASTATLVPPGREGTPSTLEIPVTGSLSAQSGVPSPDMSSQGTAHESRQEPGDILPLFVPVRRTRSEPQLIGTFDDTLMIPQDFDTALGEIKEQKVQIRQLKQQRRLQEVAIIPTEEEDIPMKEELSPQPILKTILASSQAMKEMKTPSEEALLAGRSYVILPKRSKMKKRRVNMARIEAVEEFLRRPTRKIERSDSLHNVTRVIERELRVPSRIRHHRWSVPNIFDFKEYKTKRGIMKSEDEREWVRGIWNTWFDQVYPPTPSSSEDEDDYEMTESYQDTSSVNVADDKSSKKKDSINSLLVDDIDSLEPIPDTEENAEILEILRDEIDKLTRQIELAKEPLAFDFCRRGGLYRKVGEVKKALEDLNRAIDMEPLLLDAYWHRHLLYILQGKQQAAMDDLNFIVKKNKSHAGAYRSLAEMFQKVDDITMAIINYTQAIKVNPQDHEAFFRRAQMYEKRGDMLLAMEDYSIASKILPARTDAILKRGLYYFKNHIWYNAINDFTDMLRVEPDSAVARLYRGRAYAKQQQWKLAIEDLAAAIHFDPNSWEAYYYRACILRKSHPNRSLMDYSISLMINDTDENIMSYLHRGILYDAMDQATDAICDFESVLKLNKDVACAHVNLGLIYMKKYQNYHRAIKRFGSAIKIAPTYVRAYVCRAEAYHKIHELKQALHDFTRVIHLRPDIPHFYMYRGQLVLEMGNMDLAAFCVRHAAVLNQDTSLSTAQQEAVVQSFLKNYDKAIEALVSAARSNPTGSLDMLLGKTQMKAKRFKDAVVTFQHALQLFKPWRSKDPWPPETAEAHFLSGICNTELRRYFEALENFNEAIKYDPVHAEAFYQRGLTRIKLKQSKGILDFNRALAIDPKIFQIFLSRACYYGLKGNYTKAILNCNEAIKLQPNSVRAYLYRGALKYHIRVYDLAVIDLTKAAMINSTCALAYFNRAVCYQESKKYDKALMDYGIVLLIGDDLKLKVLINRGLLYFEKKDYGNALYDFQLASKLSSDDHKIYHTLGLCHHKLGQLQQAVATFTHCIQLKPFFLDAYISRGNVYMDYGHDQGLKFASRDYQRALHLNSVCLAARVNLAYSMQVAGRFMAAWQHFTCAIAINPTFKPALEGRAIVNLQMSDTFAAFQDICQSIKVQPTSELLTNRGVINQFMNDRVNAMKDYQSAILLDPSYSLAYFNAANMYFHTRHFKQALVYYSKAIQHNPKDESAFLNRAITKVLLRDAQSALADFKTAIKLCPYSAHMYFNRGNLYTSMEQYERAEKDYSKALRLQPDDAMVLKRRADVRGKLGRRKEAVADYKYAIQIQTRPHKK